MKTIFEGSLLVAGRGYVQDDESRIDSTELGTVVVVPSKMRFKLVYPFEIPYEGVVEDRFGITLKNIFVAIRRGYRAMYLGAKVEKITGLRNKLVTSKRFGTAYHDIGDLIISRIRVHGERLYVDVDS